MVLTSDSTIRLLPIYGPLIRDMCLTCIYFHLHYILQGVWYLRPSSGCPHLLPHWEWSVFLLTWSSLVSCSWGLSCGFWFWITHQTESKIWTVHQWEHSLHLACVCPVGQWRSLHAQYISSHECVSFCDVSSFVVIMKHGCPSGPLLISRPKHYSVSCVSCSCHTSLLQAIQQATGGATHHASSGWRQLWLRRLLHPLPFRLIFARPGHLHLQWSFAPLHCSLSVRGWNECCKPGLAQNFLNLRKISIKFGVGIMYQSQCRLKILNLCTLDRLRIWRWKVLSES